MSTESPTFSLLYVYSPGQRQTIHWEQKAMTTERPLPICCKFQEDLFEIYIYSPRTRAKDPWGQTFDFNRKPLSLRPFFTSFKQISLNFDFIYIFKRFSTLI